MIPARVRRESAPAGAARQRFADEVGYYLQLEPRQLPSRYLYDALGSALFNAICELPWYRLTRAETALIAAHGATIFAALPELERIVELGAGNGVKLVTLVGARPAGSSSIHVDLVDISASALEAAARSVAEMGGVSVTGHHATYEAGMERVARGSGVAGGTLVLFLGSNIGNFDPPSADALLRHIRGSLRPGDALLLGADLVKPEAELLLAYDDPLGVTAAFNRNLLVHINRELRADFDLSRFVHRAVWNQTYSRIEMHLLSTCRQNVTVAAAGVSFVLAEGESIWTESSYKYDPQGVGRMLATAGFRLLRQWIDDEVRFALTLAEARS